MFVLGQSNDGVHVNDKGPNSKKNSGVAKNDRDGDVDKKVEQH